MSERRKAAPPDLAWVTPGFAIGSKPYAQQREAIAASGIGAVVTLEHPDHEEADAWHALGVRFVALPTTDWIAIPTKRFDRAVEVVAKELASGTSVLLHCLAGQNRAPTVAAAILCRRSGLTVEAALDAIRSVRQISAPTDEQRKSLYRWFELRCRGVSTAEIPQVKRKDDSPM